MKENLKYHITKQLVDHGGNKQRAALALGCSRRTLDRYILGYKTQGKAFFTHGNRGRRPTHALASGMIADILDLYKNKYCNANFAHFTELLNKLEKVEVSESSVRNIFAKRDIISPKANRKTRRKLITKLKTNATAAKTKKEANALQARIVDIENAHPRRPRCSNFGEMIQMDASLHFWINSAKWTLHLAVDDATGLVVGAWFEEQETLKGYYHVFEQILTNYGVPYMFYTDRRTIFEYRKSGNHDSAHDSFTQFGYACKQLGVQIETTSIPQAKGRIERLIQAMQSRLTVELGLLGVTTLEQANEFLKGFIANYNTKFALASDSITSVFEAKPSSEKIEMTLAVISERVVDCGHSIRFAKKHFRTLNKNGSPVHFYQGTKGLVIRTFSGTLFFSVGDAVYALEEIPLHERSSQNFDFKKVIDKPKKVYIPPATHPWKLAAFRAFVKKRSWQVA